ncbi:MAG: DUF1571 domain-containing protein [Planctomycetota bacterium]
MIPAPLVTLFGRDTTAHWLSHIAAGGLATAAVVVAGGVVPGEAVATDGRRSEEPRPVAVVPADGEEVVTGENARFGAALLIEDGLARLAEVEGYSATLRRREAVEGSLRPAETVALKVRQAPFGVYMKWLDVSVGRELLYVDGSHDGKMLVRPGGWRGRLLGTLKLDPHGDLAASDGRRPVTEIGLAKLGRRIADALHRDDAAAEVAIYTLRTAEADGRPVYRLTIESASPALSGPFRRTDVVIDADLLLPVRVVNYDWPTDDTTDEQALAAATLVEDYHYEDVDLAAPVSLAEFDAENPQYRLSLR